MKFKDLKFLRTILKSNKPIRLDDELYNISLGVERTARKRQGVGGVNTARRSVVDDSKIAGSYLGQPQSSAAPTTYGLTTEEMRAFKRYMSGGDSYKLNDLLRSGGELSRDQADFTRHLDRALDKLPQYQKPTYRIISFDLAGEKSYNEFVKQHRPGSVINYPAYTSTTKQPNGYPMDGRSLVHMRIDGRSGRDISQFGNEDEQEVLFKRNTSFKIISAEPQNKLLNIHMEEI